MGILIEFCHVGLVYVFWHKGVVSQILDIWGLYKVNKYKNDVA